MASELHVDAIKHSGGTSAMTIDSSGNVNTPGSVVQVLSTTKTDDFSTTSTSYTDITGLSVAITPKFSSSKILVSYIVNGSNYGSGMTLQLLRDSTIIGSGTGTGSADAEIDLYLNSQSCGVMRMYSDGTAYDSMNFTQNILCAVNDQVKFSV